MRRLYFEKNKKKKILDYLNKKSEFDLYSHLCMEHVFIKFLGYLIKNGEKNKALKIFQDCCFYIKKITRLSPIYVIKKAMSHCFFMFDHRLLKYKSKNKKKKKNPKIVHVFGLIKNQLRLNRGIKYLYYISSSVFHKDGTQISYGERLGIGILFVFFKKGFFFEEFTNLYKLMILKKLKLKEILTLQKTTKKFIVKSKRSRKDKGFHLFNPYSLSHWYKEMDSPNLMSRR